jgi:hypothetical protein
VQWATGQQSVSCAQDCPKGTHWQVPLTQGMSPQHAKKGPCGFWGPTLHEPPWGMQQVVAVFWSLKNVFAQRRSPQQSAATEHGVSVRSEQQVPLAHCASGGLSP